MSFFEIISTRHSVRQFETRSISANIVQRIPSTAVRAPYEENLQSYKILAVTKKDAKRRLADAVHGQDSVSDLLSWLSFARIEVMPRPMSETGQII
ncbi:MAG: nitroreductase family protein [Candidatus Nitrosotenuis sp.]